MKYIIILSLIVNPLISSSQIKKHIAPAVCFFVSGAAEGTMDALDFHYWKFKKVFPSVNDQFWNPEISWQNSRGQYFPFTRDAWHLMKFGNHLSTFTGVMLNTRTFKKGKKWYWYVAEGIGYWWINRAGFHLTYNIIFK